MAHDDLLDRTGGARVVGAQSESAIRLARPLGLGCARRTDRKESGMDWKDIDRLRDPGFTVARRGYDQREVDRLLGSLVEWLETDAPRELGDLAVKRKFEHVGKSTARILLTTEEETAKMLRLTEDECVELRSQAEAASLKMRDAADEYARQVRAKADEDARRAGEAARAKARQIVEEGERRRAQIEAVVSELEVHRDGAIQELERLRGELDSTIGTHSGARSHKRKAEKPGADAQTANAADAVAKA
jgi:cell division septum initiation protein DivIVA